jgi:type II restriction enzyme
MTGEGAASRRDDDVADTVARAGELLRLLDFDDERSNERSALVLLALLGLRPGSPWSTARNPRLRTVEIMQWIREHYQRDYKPNTRETIRRQTLHQFIAAGLAQENPDDPARPTNSPKWSYQVDYRALELLREADDPEFRGRLADYLTDLPGLRTIYARRRELAKIPVQLPGDDAVMLSPGGQNVLIKQVVEIFCPYFTPGGRILYVGDADAKWAVFEEDALARLGLTFDGHGKMPDLVVHVSTNNWLVLLEAASSHGPVDGTRRLELASLFGGSAAGIVYVSCFPSREQMRRHLAKIAWGTEAWCADDPTHLIHFNGGKDCSAPTTADVPTPGRSGRPTACRPGRPHVSRGRPRLETGQVRC